MTTPANVQPRFPRQANIGCAQVTAANTSSEGGGTVGTNIFLAFTADANNGSLVESLRWMPTASTPTTKETPQVGRVFISSVASGSTTSANTFLWAEVVLNPAPADNATGANTPIDVPLGFPLPAGWTILVTCHAAQAASSQWIAIVTGGDY